MAERKTSIWASGLAINLVSNVISVAVGAIVTYLSHDGSTWIKPVLAGGFAWLLTFCSLLAIRISRTFPVKVTPLNADNVQQRIRDWLDKFNMTVKNETDDQSHFLFTVTTDGGAKVCIRRFKGNFSDYITVTGLITVDEESRATFAGFTEDEKTAAHLAIKLELARAVMGYRTENGVLDDITIFKRVPITPSLNEEEVFKLVWEIEAMLNTLFIVAAMAIHRHKVKGN